MLATFIVNVCYMHELRIIKFLITGFTIGIVLSRVMQINPWFQVDLAFCVRLFPGPLLNYIVRRQREEETFSF